MTGINIKSWEIPENELNKKLKTYQLIYFYTFSPYWASGLLPGTTRSLQTDFFFQGVSNRALA